MLTEYYTEDMKRLGQEIPTDLRCCNYHASGGFYSDCNNFPLTKGEREICYECKQEIVGYVLRDLHSPDFYHPGCYKRG